MNKIYTIGFTGKNAEDFFSLLEKNNIKLLIDVRLNNVSQLAAFSKKDDLKYFLRKILNCEYTHRPDLAPTEEILNDYKKNVIDWEAYVVKYIELLNNRNIISHINDKEFANAVFLCSEHEPKYCHRRLLAEYLQKYWNDYDIVHLK